MEWMLVKSLLSLVAVLGLMVGIVYVMKKSMVRAQAPRTAVVEVGVLGHRMLTPKRSVHVLRVLNKVIVVGMTEGGMSTLAEIEDTASLQRIDERLAEESAIAGPFAKYVERYLNAFPWNGARGNRKSNGSSFD
jgi:flagellar biogenesis protein FliO